MSESNPCRSPGPGFEGCPYDECVDGCVASGALTEVIDDHNQAVWARDALIRWLHQALWMSQIGSSLPEPCPHEQLLDDILMGSEKPPSVQVPVRLSGDRVTHISVAIEAWAVGCGLIEPGEVLTDWFIVGAAQSPGDPDATAYWHGSSDGQPLHVSEGLLSIAARKVAEAG